MKKCHVVIGFNEEHPEGKAIAVTDNRKDAVEAFEEARAGDEFEFIGFARLARWEKRSKPAEDAEREAQREERIANAKKLAANTEDPGATPKEDIAAKADSKDEVKEEPKEEPKEEVKETPKEEGDKADKGKGGIFGKGKSK